MGIEGIADEIEMPFGYDYYDLPLGTLDEVRCVGPEELTYHLFRSHVPRKQGRDSVS